MTFNPGWSSAVDDKNLFVQDDANRIELSIEVDEKAQVKKALYTMINEDDGVGQLLRHKLQADPRVTFAAYRIPHRQEAVMKLAFYVKLEHDPQRVLNDSLLAAIKEIDSVSHALSMAIR